MIGSPLSAIGCNDKGWLVKGLILCLFWSSASIVSAQDVPESSVKAAFVYNFAKFVNWGHLPSTREEIVLGVIGDRPLNGELWALAGRKVGQRRIRVVHINGRPESPVRKCDLIFVGSKISGDDPRILARLGRQKTVTISDATDFAKRGGIIELYRSGSKIRFEIRNEAAKKAGVEISSKLLRLAAPRSGGQGK